MKVIKWLDEHFEETFLVFFLVLISCITMLQIIARTFFAALSWPEEFCRYCWIWSVFISLPYTMRKGNMISDYDVEVLSALARVVTGGDVPKGTLVSERELLDLEAEGNAKLIVTKQALERVRAILTTGKPLRN